MKKTITTAIIKAERSIYILTGYKLPAYRVKTRREAKKMQIELNAAHGTPAHGLIWEFYKYY